jgi:hypothetical protein
MLMLVLSWHDFVMKNGIRELFEKIHTSYWSRFLSHVTQILGENFQASHVKKQLSGVPLTITVILYIVVFLLRNKYSHKYVFVKKTNMCKFCI